MPNLCFFNVIKSNSETDHQEYLTICSILLTYLEIEFSKWKSLQDFKKRAAKHNKLTEMPVDLVESNENLIEKLIFNLQEVEFYVNRILPLIGSNSFTNEKLTTTSSHFLTRSNLFLFWACN